MAVGIPRGTLPLLLALTAVFAAPPPKFGPVVGDEFMHGVLMHGDENPGDDHRAEDVWKRLEEADREANVAAEDIGPKDAMEAMHGVLMHGDKQDGVKHMHQKKQIGPQKLQKAGPEDAMGAMHGALMHGDDSRGHKHLKDHKDANKRKDKELKKRKGVKTGPKDAMEEMHGVFMHGDQKSGDAHAHDHAQKMDEHEQATLKFKGQMAEVGGGLESLMHGQDNGHVHEKPRDSMGAKSGKAHGVPSVTDPHEVIHGHMSAQLKLGEVPSAEKQDFERWQSGDGDDDDESPGYTFPFITDTLISGVELMKRRWLSKFWGEEEDSVAFDEVDHSQDKPLTKDLRVSMDIVGNTEKQATTNIEKPKDMETAQRPPAKSAKSRAHRHDESR